jgi:fatty acid desaturase
MPRPTPTTQSRAASLSPTPAADTESSLRFSPLNLSVLAGGLAAILAGFMVLGGGSIVAGPLLLVLGFAVLVPLGIIL